MKKIVNYLHGVKLEIGRVKWPTKSEIFKNSLLTIAFIIFFSVLFYGIDLIISFIRGMM